MLRKINDLERLQVHLRKSQGDEVELNFELNLDMLLIFVAYFQVTEDQIKLRFVALGPPPLPIAP
jgi:hypothetical protein